MSLPWSLRGRLLLGAAFWTIGLFFLAIVLWHVTLGNRHPPALMAIVLDNAAVVAVLCAGLLVAGLLQVRRGWSPINQLRARLARLDAGADRRLDGEYPSEVAPLVGDLTVKYQALNPSGDPDQVLIVYTTEPGSDDETSLRLLANWHEGERPHSTIDTRS